MKHTSFTHTARSGRTFAWKSKAFISMQKCLLATTMLFAGTGVFAQQAQQDPTQEQPRVIREIPRTISGYVPGRLLVKFRAGAHPVVTQTANGVSMGDAKLDALNSRYGCTKFHRIATGKENAERLHIYTFDFPATANVEEMIKAYKATGAFAIVEPDYLEGIMATTPNDPSFGILWGLFNNGTFTASGISPVSGADMDMKLAWDITTGSSSTIVAVIDAGVKMDHPEFSGRIWQNTGDVAGNGIDDDGNGLIDDYRGWDFVNSDNDPTDDHSHGTHVAGTIAAKGNNGALIAGADWNCKVMCLKTLAASGSGSTSYTIEAIYYATTKGAKVINMSLGGSGSSAVYQDAIDYAHSRDVTVVAAMGNDNVGTPFYPAAYNHVIAVGATTPNDTRAYFSNFGSHISVCAPGYYIASLSHTSNTSVIYMSGTSMATPNVAGVVALMIAADPSKTPDQIKAILEETADDLVGAPSEDVAGFDHYHGHGRVNAYQALLYCNTPNAITGASFVCSGTTTALASTTTGGAWTSSNTAVATVNSSGVVTGVSAGTVTITYKKLLCFATKTLTVGSNISAVGVTPSSGAICLGGNVPVTASATAGVNIVLSEDWNLGVLGGWTVTSNNITGYANWQIRNSGGYTGSVTGDGTNLMEAVPAIGGGLTTTTLVSPAFSTVGYTALTLSYNQRFVNNATDIAANVQYSLNGTTWTTIVNQLGVGVYGTTWSAGTPQVSVAMPAGALGQATVYLRWNYSANSGQLWTIDNVAVKGNSPVTYSWTGIAGASGLSCTSCASPTITPTGTGTKVYSVTASSFGCSSTSGISINVSSLTSSTGTATVCAGGTTTLSNSTGGGTWSSGNTAVATVGTGGVVAGVSSGTANITYALSSGCLTFTTVTVNSLSTAITGTASVCVGNTTALANATPSGTWSSSSPSIASVNSSGVVTGGIAGTATISYVAPGGCYATRVVTVTGLPAAITGTASVCVGGTTALADATLGGTWSSSATGVATVGTSGIVTGVAAGNATIYYTTSSGCAATREVTVNANPATISGSSVACVGATTTLTTTPAGGTWTSSATGIGTVGASTGVVGGIAAGPVNITYTLSTGCFKVHSLTVNASPAAITGTANVCVGSTTALADATMGGTWSSSVPAVGTVGTSGIVTGIAAGTTNISYTLSTGCAKVQMVTVNPVPAAISGTAVVCAGLTTTLTTTSTGGTWSSSTATVGTIGTSGVVAGIGAGTTNISYSFGTGCRATKIVTVNSSPAAIMGTMNVCVGSNTTLTTASTGGTWSSSTPTIGTVGTSGIVTGIAAGTVNIYYMFSTGCGKVATVTVNPVPAAISGTAVVCVGATTALSTTSTGGTWSSSTATVGTIGTSGVVAGIGAGTTNISYSFGTGCRATKIVTVNSSPAAISGTTNVCVGSTIPLTNATLGGTWSSSMTAVGTVGTSGIVTGISSGSTTITYALATGCFKTHTVTVNPVPAAISGTAVVCAGLTTTLATTSTGGTWSSSTATVGTIGTSGVVAGIGAGTTNISYSFGTGCRATKIVTVNSSPAAIMGTMNVCVGSNTTLTTASTGGTWSSSTPTIGTVGTSGIVTGIAAGTVNIYYMFSTGCGKVATVTVNPVPAAISGTAVVCVGATTALSTTSTGGTWSSSTATVGTIGTSGVVAGIGAGTTNISYSFGTGCRATKIVTVNSSPAAISGTTNVCVGSTISLTDATLGGTWSSSITAVGTVGTSGVVTGIAPGSTTITYALGTGCFKTHTVTVNPVPAAISGTAVVCVGATTALSTTSTGGTWSSSTATIGTVGTSGVVTGIGAGTTNISYSFGTGCRATKIVTVNSSPAAISGTTNVCVGSTIPLTNATLGGTWSSSITAVGTVGTSGVVTGISSGSTTITYALATGCFKAHTVTVNPVPAAISGTAVVCVGATTALSTTSTGGTWSSSTATVGTIGTSGVVAGIGAGTTNISYSFGTGCRATKIVTVNSSPAAISGTTNVCVGSTIPLTNATLGGTWSSSITAVGTVGTSGVVTGISSGSTTITYALGTGCFKVHTVTVNPVPAAISGTAVVCVGATTALSTTSTGGTWSSSTATVGTIGTSGVVTGIGAGTTNISYSFGTGCRATKIVTVNSSPAAISGTTNVCVGSTIPLTNATLGGTWSSSITAVGTVGTSGVVTGISSGSTTITYALGTGCFKVHTVTVNPVPAAISGTAVVCVGATTALSTTSTGGTWSSSTATVGTIGTSGVVAGIGAGTTNISYSFGTGCRATKIVTVNSSPAAISGTTNVCVGSTIPLTNATLGGTWSSSMTAVGTVGTSGIVTGISSGSTTITYALATGCFKAHTVTVNPVPAAISGTAVVCVGATTALSTTSTGGTWSSSTATVGTIGTSGVVAGIGAGTTNISYSFGTGCRATKIVTVNSSPAAISGTTNVCVGSTIPLTNATLGGTWSSSITAVGTVGTSGIVTGIATGSTTITYALATGCFKTHTVTVNPVPAAISGTAVVCVGATTALSTTSTGGTWSSSTATVGTIGTSGVVAGIGAGTTNISYSFGTGCRATKIVTVNSSPAAISGTTNVCVGSTIPLTNATLGGTWSSSITAVGTVGTSGIVTGISSGSTTITYALATGCFKTHTVTVNPVPAAISGTAVVCVGATTALSTTSTGGTWSSSTATVGTIGTSGVVAGIGAGTTNISYSFGTGCRATKIVTVNSSPAAISGTTNVCVGSTIPLTDATLGGTWSSSMTAVGTVGTSGVVTGIFTGSTTITYALGTGCFKTHTVTVNPVPAAISGTAVVCVGATTALSTTSTGGTWSSSTATIGTIGTSGVVTGIGAGTTNISYSFGTGCRATKIVTVSANPANITGTFVVCQDAVTNLANLTAGGAWSSSVPATATVGTSGIVSGVLAGTATISYTMPTGCFKTQTVTVNPAPAAIGGTLAILVTGTSTLTTTSTGGTWSSSATSVATIGSTSGIMTGVGAGTSTITYKFTSTGCRTTAVATVGAMVGKPTDLVEVSVATMRIYPNPSSGLVSVEATVRGTLAVYTVDGKELQRYDIATPVTTVSLPNNLAAGMYMCRFEGEDGSTAIVRLVYKP